MGKLVLLLDKTVYVSQETRPKFIDSQKEQPRLWHTLTQYSVTILGEYGDSSV